MANLAGKSVDRTARKAAKAAARPLRNKAVRVGVAKIGNDLSEYGEEFAQGAVNVATRDKAYKTVESEIGQYGRGNVDLYNRPVYTNADGSISTVDSVTFEIDGKYVLLPTIARDENGKAIRLETDEEILAHYAETGEYLGEFKNLEEANAYATKLHTAQEYIYSDHYAGGEDNLWKGGAKVVGAALFGDNPELLSELHGLGMEGAKTSFVSGGARTIANNIIYNYANAKTVKNQNEIADAIIADEESLNALIEEGKASGAGTVSEDIATEIETAKANGKAITREQVKSLIEANEVYIKEEERIEKKTTAPATLEQVAMDVVNERNRTSTPSGSVETIDLTPVELVERKSLNGVRISEEEAQKASGYGTNGSTLLAEAVNNSPDKSFSQVKGDMHLAYMSGMSNKNKYFENDFQREAYYAGKKDRIMQDLERKEQAKAATVYEGTFTGNEYTKNFTDAERTMISTVAKSLGMDISVVDKVIASVVNGKVYEANAEHQDGKMRISSTADKVISELVLHEGGHRMRQLAPKEFGILMDALYARSMRENATAGLSQNADFDNVKAEHDNAGITMDTSGYIEEVAVRELETIFDSPEAFNKWYAEISGNQQVKTAWDEFVAWLSEIIEDIKRAWSQRKMTAEEKAKAKKTLAELERIKELYTNAYKAAENTVAERRQEQAKQNSDTNSANALENKTNKEYNGNKSHSLYNEYNSTGMQWAYNSDTQVGDRKVLYNSYTDEFVLVEATKDGVGFVEVMSGTYEQMREEKEYYETEKQAKNRADGSEETVDKVLRDFGLGRNNNTRNNVDVENRGRGTQNAEIPEGKSRSDRTADPKATGVKQNKSFSLKWHTDLSKNDLIELMNEIKYDIRNSKNAITDEANWLFTDIGGKDVFAIYSTDDYKDPTLLYESKGKKANLERDILMDLLEVIENGESINGQSSFASRIPEGDWVQKINSSQDNLQHVGRGSNNRNAGVLQRQPRRDGSRAFRNVIENLFEVSDGVHGRGRGVRDGVNYSLKGGLSGTEIRNAITNKKLDKYVDKGIITTEKYNELVKTYGAIPEGEKPHRAVQVPQKTAEDKKVSQTVRTILEAKATPDEYVPTIEKMVEDGVFSYDVYTDEQAINDADSYIKKYGWDESLDDWFKDVENGVVSKQHTAMGWALYNNAANIAATTTSETERTSAVKTSLKILDAMVRHQRSAAQALQATRILKQLSPETQLYAVQKSVKALQKELADKYGDKAPDLKVNEELAEQFLTAESDEERAEIEAEIYKDIGRQMPSRFIDKWNAWRYLAMLGNPRTHVRNIVGNTGFAPVVFTKDLAATAIESIVNRVSPKKMVRGKALITGSKADRALLKAAWGDYGNVAERISNGGKYNDSAMAKQHIEEGRRIFKFKPLETARKGNSALLEKEDMWFAQPHYAYALAQYCKANNITAEQIKMGKAIAPARDYAVKEAQKATYRDTNAFSQFGRKTRGRF